MTYEHLAPPKMTFSPIGSDAEISTFILGRDNYLLYEMERLVQQNQHKLKSDLCVTTMEERGTEIIRVGGNNFIRRNGDTVEHFTCLRKHAAIKINPKVCHEDIPLEDG